MTRLYNVIDIRDNRHYSVVVVSERKAKYFVPAADSIQAEEPDGE